MASRKKHPLYSTWSNMARRCRNSEAHHYKYYGGRGIKVCDRWLVRGDGFRNFLADMGPKPSESHQLDRIDFNGDYTPENTRWATPTQQAINRRTFENNTSGQRGVDHYNGAWRVRVQVKGKSYLIGIFATKDIAVLVASKVNELVEDILL